MRRSIQDIIAEYGPVALVVYLAIFVSVLVGSWAAIHFGWQPQSTGGNLGVLAGAYVATKATQPFRIAGTLLLTPFAAKVYNRVRGDVPEAEPAIEPGGD